MPGHDDWTTAASQARTSDDVRARAPHDTTGVPSTGGVSGGEQHDGDPHHHAAWLHRMLTDVAQHARDDVTRVADPQARALFETAAEVCLALARTYEHYDRHAEPAWQ